MKRFGEDLFSMTDFITPDGEVVEMPDERIIPPAVNLLTSNHATMRDDMSKEAVAEVYYEVMQWALDGYNNDYEAAFTMDKSSKIAQKIMFKTICEQVRHSNGKYENRVSANRENGKKGGRPRTVPADVSEPMVEQWQIDKLMEHYRVSYVKEVLERKRGSRLTASELEQALRNYLEDCGEDVWQRPLFC